MKISHFLYETEESPYEYVRDTRYANEAREIFFSTYGEVRDFFLKIKIMIIKILLFNMKLNIYGKPTVHGKVIFVKLSKYEKNRIL